MRFRLLTASALAALIPLSAQAVGIQVMVDGRAVTFSDVQQSIWFSTYVRQAAELGIISGYRDAQGNPTGKFGPAKSITMAESLKIAVEGAGYDKDAYATLVNSGVRHWASMYVAVGKSEGFPVVENTARLDRPATRAEVAALMAAAFRLDLSNVVAGTRYTDVSAQVTAAAAIEQLSRDKIIGGDTDVNGTATGKFRPNEPINRAEVAKMIILARTEYGTPGKGRSPGQVDGGDQAQHNVVTYTSNGFSPAVLHITLGDTVVFKNAATAQMWVASDPHPTHTGLPGFDANKGIVSNASYSFTFMRRGTFGYHNHLNASDRGTIIVEEKTSSSSQ